MRAVITLHSVDESGSVLSIRPSELDSLLDAIEAAGHAVVPLSELLGAPGVPDRVALTFDDALASVAEEGLPLLARRGLVGSVFVVTGRIGQNNAWPGQPGAIPTLPCMGWGELEALREAGWEIGSHTVTHARLTELTDAQIEDEIGGAYAEIERHIGVVPEVLAFPYGDVDDRVRAHAGKHHRFALGGRLAALDPAVDHPLQLPRLDAYYLRAPSVHRWFGTPAMSGWLGVRARARDVRKRLGDR